MLTTRIAFMGLMLLFAAGASAQDGGKEVFSAFAVQTVNVARTTALEIIVNHWSTPVQRARLIGAMSEGGQEAMTAELSKQDTVGVIRLTGGAARGGRTQFQLRYAREFPSADGRQIILATDRYIAFWDADRNPTTEENNLTYVVLTLDQESNGEGQVMIGAEMKWEDEKLRVDIVAQEPVRLLKVKKSN